MLLRSGRARSGSPASRSSSTLGMRPAFLDVRQVGYVALQGRSSWEADALPRAEATEAGWRISLPAGLVRQVWLDFRLDQRDCPAGDYRRGR